MFNGLGKFTAKQNLVKKVQFWEHFHKVNFSVSNYFSKNLDFSRYVAHPHYCTIYEFLEYHSMKFVYNNMVLFRI